MITKELLEKNKHYVLTHMDELHYGSIPKPMFRKGKFQTINWNGGDNVIRQFLINLEWKDNFRPIYQNKDITMIIDYKIYEDSRYVDIVVIHHLINDIVIDKYFFGWYKNRGRTDYAKKNGEILLEKDYIKLLNIIENITKFKFKFYK